MSGIELASSFTDRSNVASAIYVEDLVLTEGVREKPYSIRNQLWIHTLTHLSPLLVSHKKKLNFGHSPVNL